MSIRLFTCLTFLGVLVAAGCSGRPATAPIKGTVTFDGKPIANGTIRFETTGRSATGKIVQGEVVDVTTFEPDDGALLGSHKVAIWAFAEAPGAASPDKKDLSYMSGTSLIPERYNNPETSGLIAEIKPGVNNLEFKLFAKSDTK